MSQHTHTPLPDPSLSPPGDGVPFTPSVVPQINAISPSDIDRLWSLDEPTMKSEWLILCKQFGPDPDLVADQLSAALSALMRHPNALPDRTPMLAATAAQHFTLPNTSELFGISAGVLPTPICSAIDHWLLQEGRVTKQEAIDRLSTLFSSCAHHPERWIETLGRHLSRPAMERSKHPTRRRQAVLRGVFEKLTGSIAFADPASHNKTSMQQALFDAAITFGVSLETASPPQSAHHDSFFDTHWRHLVRALDANSVQAIPVALATASCFSQSTSKKIQHMVGSLAAAGTSTIAQISQHLDALDQWGMLQHSALKNPDCTAPLHTWLLPTASAILKQRDGGQHSHLIDPLILRAAERERDVITAELSPSDQPQSSRQVGKSKKM